MAAKIFVQGGRFLRELLDSHGRVMGAAAILGSVGGGALVTGITHSFTNLSGWYLAAVGFLSTGVFLALCGLAVRNAPAQMQVATGPRLPATSGIGASGQQAFDFDQHFAAQYHSSLAPELEQKYKMALTKYQNGTQREEALIRFASHGLIAYLYDSTWAYMYKSQVLLLQELNSKPLTVNDAEQFYDQAAKQYPIIYAAYSFDAWLDWLNRAVLTFQQGNTLGITPRGRDFLKYLVHWGKSPNEKNG